MQVTPDHWKAGASELAGDQIGGPTGDPISVNLGLSSGATKPANHEKTPGRHSLTGVKAPPVGLQQSSKTLGNSNETDLVVTPVVTLDARTAELMAIWDQLDGGQREQALEWLRSKTKYASD